MTVASVMREFGAPIFPLVDYDIFKLHYPFSMLVAGPQGAGKSEFVKQLSSLKCHIMTGSILQRQFFGFMVDINQTCFVLWLKKFQA